MNTHSAFSLDLPASAAGALRLVIVENHAMLLEGLVALLKLEADFDIVGTACNALDGIALARQLAPDVIITDLSLGEHSGIQLIAEVRKLTPAAKVLVLTAHGGEEHIKGALSAGARGYVLKDTGRAELFQAIRAVGANHYFLCRRASKAVVSNFLPKGGVPNGSAPALLKPLTLTERECEIITLIAQGNCNRLIGCQLKRSIKTVAKHRANIMRKLGLRSAVDITRYAMFNDLIPPDELRRQVERQAVT